jgi:cytochrome c-type biogenesis protein CcmF
VVGGSLLLYAWRAPALGSGSGFALISRESMLLANNVVLVVAMAAVLLGTLYPLALDTLGLGKISVGPPYFEAVFYPLMAPAMFLMVIGPLARWKQAPLPDIARRLRWALAVAIVAALLQPLTTDAGFRPIAASGLAFGLWIAAGVLVAALEMLRNGEGRLQLSRARLHPASVWGMQLAHLGVAVFVIGVTLVKSSESERELQLAPGQSAEIGGFRIDFKDLRTVAGPNYDAMRGRFELRRTSDASDSPPRAVLLPEKRVYRAQRMPMTEAAIDRSLWRDVYVSMGEPLSGSNWAIRIHVKPFVNWIWLGCVLMALGGFVAIADRRYRRRLAAREAPEATSTELATERTASPRELAIR